MRRRERERGGWRTRERGGERAREAATAVVVVAAAADATVVFVVAAATLCSSGVRDLLQYPERRPLREAKRAFFPCAFVFVCAKHRPWSKASAPWAEAWGVALGGRAALLRKRAHCGHLFCITPAAHAWLLNLIACAAHVLTPPTCATSSQLGGFPSGIIR